MRLAKTLLLSLALLSVLGTILPQLEDLFGRHWAPATMRLLQSLGVFDIYHSPLFLILTGLLVLYLIVCIARRLSIAGKAPAAIPLFPRPLCEEIPLASAPDYAPRLEKLLRAHYTVRTETNPAGALIYAECGRINRSGVNLIHLGVLLTIVGMLLGAKGFKGYVQVPEGRTISRIGTEDGVKPLGFSIRCEDLHISFYQNGMPREFRAMLSFLKDNRPVYQGPLLVNHPITFEGQRFYLTDYGTLPEAVLRIKAPGYTATYRVYAGDTLNIRKTPVRIVHVEDDLMGMGPAIEIGVSSAQGEMNFWVLQEIDKIMAAVPDLSQRAPRFDPGIFKPYVFSLQTIDKHSYAGLMAAADPGVPVVAAGAVLLLAGLFVTFLLPHRQIWIRLTPETAQVVALANGRQGVLDPALRITLSSPIEHTP